MSVQHVAFVLERSLARNKDRFVLLSIANHADENDEAWPSMACMAYETGLAEGVVERAIRSLVRAGRITRVVNGSPDRRIPGNLRPNLYRINMTPERLSWADEKRRRAAAAAIEHQRDGGDESSDPRLSTGADDSSPMGGTNRPPKPSVEPPEDLPPPTPPHSGGAQGRGRRSEGRSPRQLAAKAKAQAQAQRSRALLVANVRSAVAAAHPLVPAPVIDEVVAVAVDEAGDALEFHSGLERCTELLFAGVGQR